MKKEINQIWFFKHSPEIVWEYLTKSELMEQWLMKNDFQLAVGHRFKFISNPVPSLEFDGIINCQVLEFVPFEKLSYSWECRTTGNTKVDSIVEWTLFSKNNGTELVLKHGEFKKKALLNIYLAMKQGWLQNIQKIEKLIENGK